MAESQVKEDAGRSREKLVMMMVGCVGADGVGKGEAQELAWP